MASIKARQKDLITEIAKVLNTDEVISDVIMIEGQPLSFKGAAGGIIYSDFIPLSADIEEFCKSHSNNSVHSNIEEVKRNMDAFNFKLNIAEFTSYGNFRVSLFPSLSGLSAVMRTLPNSPIDFISEICMDDILKQEFSHLLRSKSGLIIISGPTGSGKSTTITSMLDWINKHDQRTIVTIEDPVEFMFENDKSIFIQKEVGESSTSFYQGIIDGLRQSPDIIFIAEIRTPKEIEAAIMAAETGHLVLTTLHTPRIESIPGRIINAFPENSMGEIRDRLALSLKACLTQRLLNERGEVKAYFEGMFVNPAVRSLIMQGSDVQMTSYIEQQNSKRINHILLERLAAGTISLDTALSLATDAAEIIEKKPRMM